MVESWKFIGQKVRELNVVDHTAVRMCYLACKISFSPALLLMLQFLLLIIHNSCLYGVLYVISPV